MVKVKFTLDRRTDGQGDSYIPPQTSFVGGIITGKCIMSMHIMTSLMTL